VKLCENCFLAQNVTEIRQSAAELWPKTIFNMAAFRHLEFEKFILGYMTVIEFQMCCCVPNFIKIGRFSPPDAYA